jgi:hypothetical protein
MRAATVIGVIGDGEGGGEGRVVSREMLVNRTIEGEMTLSTKSAVSVADIAVANMVFNVVAGLSSKRDERERKKVEKKKEKGSARTTP